MVLAVRWKSDCGQDEAQVASTGAWISAPWHGLWVDIWLVLKISGLDFNGFLPRRSGGGDPNLGHRLPLGLFMANKTRPRRTTRCSVRLSSSNRLISSVSDCFKCMVFGLRLLMCNHSASWQLEYEKYTVY